MTTTFEDREMLKSFESVALPRSNELLRRAISLLGNRSDAEDAVQDCFLYAWRSFHRFQAGTNCRAWLHKILKHVIYGHRRKRRRFPTSEDPQILQKTVIAREDIPLQLTDEELLAAVSKLPQRYAIVVLLTDVQGFTYKEVQEALDIPIGTVMSRLHRARRDLRTQLASLRCSQSGAIRLAA